MERRLQLEYCKKCTHQKFDLKQGIICNLTNEKAKFEGVCDLFLLDNSHAHIIIDNKKKQQKKYNSRSWPYIFLALFILIAFLSNPKTEDHREALRVKLFGIVEESLSENTENLFYIGLGKSFGNVIIDEALKNVSIDNYLFFSLTKFNYSSNSEIIGIGILGNVYISEKVNKEMFN
ncbi:MAG: hypothetical protein QM478_06465 [Flavobacteriaceae bacterium]